MKSVEKKSNRLDEIDKLKGFAIFLVVLGHIVARENPANNDWYAELKSTIYLFHMPLFMFLSGLILAYARKPIDSFGDYLRHVKSKFYRLMPAYLLFSLVVFVGKMAMGSVMHVDNSVGSLLDYFDVLTNPLGSYCAYLWYIYVLFIFYAIAPLVYYLTRYQIHLCLPVCLMLHFVELPGLCALSSLGEYAFVFFLGCVAGDHYNSYSKWISRYGAAFVTPFLVVLYFATAWGVPKFAMGLLAIPACQALVSMKLADSWGFLKTLSTFTFPIYLMNTLFIGLTKGVLFKFTTWDGYNFLWFAPLLLLAGVLGPIIAQELVIRRSNLLKQFIA